MQLIESHTVPSLSEPLRLQDYAVGIFTVLPTKSGVKKAIKQGRILLNGNATSTGKFVCGGEELTLLGESEVLAAQIDLPLTLWYQDEHLAVVEKPAGIAVSGNKKRTLANALSSQLKPSNEQDACLCKPVHRLDYPTSGLLLVGKTTSCIRRLHKLFEQNEIKKTYHAIAIGILPEQGSISEPIDKKESTTAYKVLDTVGSERFGHLQLMALNPKTGRRHQLRKHLAGQGNPILGDREYGIAGKILKGKGLYLHASCLEFTHPITGTLLNIKSELPKKFLKIFSTFKQE